MFLKNAGSAFTVFQKKIYLGSVLPNLSNSGSIPPPDFLDGLTPLLDTVGIENKSGLLDASMSVAIRLCKNN